MRITKLTALTACVLQAWLAAAACAEDWTFSTSVNFDSGRYGTSDRTDSLYIPFTLKRYYSDSELSVSVPWLRQNTSGSVTLVGGRPVRAARQRTAAVKRTVSGPGDVLLRGTYRIKADGPSSFGLYLGGKLKLPTADKAEGLGTGEMDEGAGAEFEKRISDDWTLLADWYFTIIGDTAQTDYNNQVAMSAGFTRPLAKGVSLTVLYATSSALLPGNSDPRELDFTVSAAGKTGVRFKYSLLFGLSDGSPDLGASAGFSRRF